MTIPLFTITPDNITNPITAMTSWFASNGLWHGYGCCNGTPDGGGNSRWTSIRNASYFSGNSLCVRVVYTPEVRKAGEVEEFRIVDSRGTACKSGLAQESSSHAKAGLLIVAAQLVRAV